jgi:PKHD-type hydroxylase
VNAAWWKLELDAWDLKAKRYRPGDRHTRHQDTHGGAVRRKFAGSVQLSHSDAYEGGDLLVHHADDVVAVPRARGTLVAFPAWAMHEVEPVTSGERWALIVNGWGPPYQ